jgi:hypothetical protein
VELRTCNTPRIALGVIIAPSVTQSVPLRDWTINSIDCLVVFSVGKQSEGEKH